VPGRHFKHMAIFSGGGVVPTPNMRRYWGRYSAVCTLSQKYQHFRIFLQTWRRDKANVWIDELRFIVQTAIGACDDNGLSNQTRGICFWDERSG
jgi:hypothetical protein